MAKKQIRKDETFGELIHVVGDLWKRPLELRIFGRKWTISLLVDISPQNGIEPNQVLAHKQFGERTATVTAAAEEAVFHYYQSVCIAYRTRFGVSDPDDERVPIVRSTKELFSLVQPEGVTFPYARPRPTFGILCQCTWEEEHGLAVKYEHGKVVEVGFQDIVL